MGVELMAEEHLLTSAQFRQVASTVTVNGEFKLIVLEAEGHTLHSTTKSIAGVLNDRNYTLSVLTHEGHYHKNIIHNISASQA